MMVPTADEKRYQALCDALLVCRMLAAAPATLYDLARAAGRSTRTIRRIVTTLRRAGVDIEALRSADGPAVRYTLNRVTWLTLLDLPGD
jgi:predicted DNA-binding transcriptional regulator YafY